MYCVNCGSTLNSEWKVCPYCGYRIPLRYLPKPNIKQNNLESNPYYFNSSNIDNYNSSMEYPSLQKPQETILSPKKRLSKTQKKAIIITCVIVLSGIITGLSIFFGLNQVRTINYYVNNGVSARYYTVIIPRGNYNFYTNEVHPSHSYSDYDLMVSTIETYCTPDDTDMINLAQYVHSQCVDQNDDEEVMNALLSFSQGIGYHSETGDRCQYPLETLFDQGDCEDLAVFFASLAEAIGYQAILLCVALYDYSEYEWVGHIIVGIYLAFTPDQHPDSTSWYYEVGGNKYWVCETTDQGWMVGQLPVSNPDDLVVLSYAEVS